VPTGALPALPAAVIVGKCDVSLWGLDARERWRRWLARAGVAPLAQAGAPPPTTGRVILVRADYVLQEHLGRALAASADTILVVPSLAVLSPSTGAGTLVQPIAANVAAERLTEVARILEAGSIELGKHSFQGLAPRLPSELSSGYQEALRKRSIPFALAVTAETVEAVEWRMFTDAYKGVTDFVTKWVWPVPAFWVTRWATRGGISANMVTWASLLFVFLALWRFAVGDLAGGLICAWIMTFLDTVDGKLARVTLTSSKAGNAFDHGIDLIHPPFWYFAWWVGLGAMPAGWGGDLLEPAMWITVLGYVVGRLIEGLFLWRFGFELHAWRPVDAFMRLFTARRNPNLALLTVFSMLAAPGAGLVAIAGWTIFCLLFHVVRVGQAFLAARRGTLASWLAVGGAARPQ